MENDAFNFKQATSWQHQNKVTFVTSTQNVISNQWLYITCKYTVNVNQTGCTMNWLYHVLCSVSIFSFFCPWIVYLFYYLLVPCICFITFRFPWFPFPHKEHGQMYKTRRRQNVHTLFFISVAICVVFPPKQE